MTPGSSDLLTVLLKEVSRSFYLTLRILPAGIRPQIGLAYLLARTADTIADTEIVPLAHRLEALQCLRKRLLGETQTPLNFATLARHQGAPAERALLDRCEEALAMLGGLNPADQRRIHEVLDVISSGQELDLKRFASAQANRITALQTELELDDYTYRVAGCVGEFWTKMCRAHLFPNARLDDGFLLANAIRFGKGLQLVNILRDLPADLRRSRFYLPEPRLLEAGLAPEELLKPENEPRFRPLYHAYIGRARGHLAAGWSYTNALPRSQFRLRLGCALPILIGVQTLEKLRSANVLDHQNRVKVSRQDVRKLLLRLAVLYPFAARWRGLFDSFDFEFQQG